MNTRKLTTLTAIAGILALGKFGTAVMIGLGKDANDTATWSVGVVFGVFFLTAVIPARAAR